MHLRRFFKAQTLLKIKRILTILIFVTIPCYDVQEIKYNTSFNLFHLQANYFTYGI
jgi:hypothetical protein